MSTEQKPVMGRIGWIDLTVDDAARVRDFYARVTGWTPEAADMGDYSDFSMLDAAGDPAAGVCHARGANADQPPQWMIYVYVADLDASLAACRAAGGEVVAGPKSHGAARFAVIRDPAGAVAGLYQAG